MRPQTKLAPAHALTFFSLPATNLFPPQNFALFFFSFPKTTKVFNFVSLSMKFQASRFSASGREMPLEPHRSEACRSCQPMHVLSFGEGRKCFCFCPSRISVTSVWCMKRCTRWIFFECLVIMDILCASEESNAPNCLDGDSMIVCFCFLPRDC